MLGEDGVLTGSAVSERAAGIWRKDHIVAPVIFRPRNTEEVSAVLQACHAVGQPVVTHGGLTGLVEGAIATEQDVVLSTERMTVIETVNELDRTMQVQAGVRLQAAQDCAAESGLMVPLDLGARGSCTLGGNAATNAGGNRVIRYGMTRDMILGLEAVLADGTVVSSMNAMLKNNAGYDLKQLFVGTEGTLGVITRLMLRLRPAWRSQETALVSCDSFKQVGELLNHLDASLGGTLSAFELMWRDFYTLVATTNPPLTNDSPYYVLVEALGSESAADAATFESAIAQALDNRLINDAMVCKSGQERDALWAMRDDVEQTLEHGPAYIFDVSLRLSDMESYINEVLAMLDENCPGHKTWVFGHAGDGNLHIVCAAANRSGVEQSVYEPLRRVSGSVSGEHGIGLEKKSWLTVSRNDAEIRLMRQLKQALDPLGILNPGRVFDMDEVS
ncbi:MAG: FAD-binding oxidoreductase [Gammaproteobacteria bacterium]